jgi:ketosteroid isomerase-like protein
MSAAGAAWGNLMKHPALSIRPGNTLRNSLVRALLFSMVAVLFFAGVTPAQKQKKKKGQDDQKNSSGILPPLPDDRAIDMTISEMLGAWQIGDIERLHKYYSDDVVVVSGAWEPPVVGWNNYLKAYQAQRQRAQSIRLDRFNTVVKVEGNVGWANYQWRFDATIENSPFVAVGQTTLILEKRKDQWVIVHNHTSLVQQTTGTQPAAASPPAPQKPPGAQ